MAHRSIDQVEVLVGEKIRAFRLDRNLPQEVVASKAGISRGSLQRMEAGQGSTLGGFIRVLKALQLEDWFDTLAPIPAINPLLFQSNDYEKVSWDRSPYVLDLRTFPTNSD